MKFYGWSALETNDENANVSWEITEKTLSSWYYMYVYNAMQYLYRCDVSRIELIRFR